jgi:hypothetical protein
LAQIARERLRMQKKPNPTVLGTAGHYQKVISTKKDAIIAFKTFDGHCGPAELLYSRIFNQDLLFAVKEVLQTVSELDSKLFILENFLEEARDCEEK